LRNPFNQVKNLQTSYTSACVAEKNLNQIKNIAKEEFTSHSLISAAGQSVS